MGGPQGRAHFKPCTRKDFGTEPVAGSLSPLQYHSSDGRAFQIKVCRRSYNKGLLPARCNLARRLIVAQPSLTELIAASAGAETRTHLRRKLSTR
jgi:hypothetical protein